MAHARLAALSLAAPLLALPAHATTLGPLMTLDAGPAAASQRAPAAAWDGTRYVVVWEDGRNAGGTGVDLYLTRMSPNGMILDGNGIALLSPAQNGDQTGPAIAYNPLGLSFLVAWTDPRSGQPDIYAASFLPAGMGTLPLPGGLQLTIGAAAESQAAIGCATQSCLVAWQATSAGITEVRGTRIDATADPVDPSPVDLVGNGTGRSSEIFPEVIGLGSSFLVGWEDDRNNLMGMLGADLFGRTVPDLGPIPASDGVSLVSAPFRQSQVAFAAMSGTSILAVWQDQRARTGTTADDDIWRRFFTQTLAAGAVAEGALLLYPRNQIQPRAAAGANGRALAVWEDFRSGVYGATWATRVDAMGRALEAQGFPVIDASANVIEHVVVKGPGDDYLVLAVRSAAQAGQIPRILYRIVRDEPPAGRMSTAAPIMVPADGVSTATVSFGPAQGASGFPVIDGTLYTLTVGSASPTVNLPDADPNTPGLQVRAFNGRVTFGLRSLRPERLFASVASLEGTSAGTATVTFANVPPVASNVVLAPSSPRSSEDLVLTYGYRDVNGDPEGATQIQWTRNNAIEASFNNMRTVPESAINRGDSWRARVRPFDGMGFGDFVFSNTVVVRNSPPTAQSLRIEPAMGVRTGTMLRARYQFVDPDRDAESMSSLQWFDRGMPQPQLAGMTEVPGAMVRKGQVWSFTVLPNDGFETGPVARSSSVAVVNTVPTANAGQDANVMERRMLTLDGSASSDADPGDVLGYRWAQTQGPRVTLTSSTSAMTSFTAPSVSSTTMLELTLVVSDGESSSTPARIVVLVRPVPDADADGLDDEEEATAGTNPMFGDTDMDGMKDGPEVAAGLDPKDADSDDDGVRDGDEDMGTEDSDGDMLVNALDPDSDGDGLFDGTEKGVTSALTDTDTSKGRFKADADPSTTTGATVADTDMDGISDGVEDANHDGRVDLGESDPNDGSSKVGCAPDRTCPSGLVCERDACRSPATPDGGLMCTTLASRNTECCMGGCNGGTPTTPICLSQGAVEQCPLTATQCVKGACSNTVTPMPTDSGCGCTASSRPDASWWVLLALALAFTTRRRRSNR